MTITEEIERAEALARAALAAARVTGNADPIATLISEADDRPTLVCAGIAEILGRAALEGTKLAVVVD